MEGVPKAIAQHMIVQALFLVQMQIMLDSPEILHALSITCL